jgi:cell division protein FtsB
MGKATLARQKAIGAIGVARVQKLDESGLTIIETSEYERLKERVAGLERQNKLLRSLALGCVETRTVAEQILAASMMGNV